MKDHDIFKPEWLAFEQELGFRPLLHGPTYQDIIQQNTDIGLALMSKFTYPLSDPSVKTSEHKITSGVRLKIYTPANLKRDHAVVLYVHGGGCVFGSVDEDDVSVSRYAIDAGMVFVSVEYRLAPQCPYPAGLEDCIEAAKWCIEHAHNVGGADRKVILMGVSAGATLALATGLKLVKEGKRGEIDGIIAIQPFTLHPDAVPEEFQQNYKSYDEHAQHTINTKQATKAFFDLHGAPPTNFYIFPALNHHIKDLPCVYLSACGADTLRDDAGILKKLLDKHGVPNVYDEFAKLPHLFFAYPSHHLDAIRDDYYAKTAAGIAFVVESSIQSPVPLC